MAEPRAITTADLAQVIDHLKRSAENVGTLNQTVLTLSQTLDRTSRNAAAAAANTTTLQTAIDGLRQDVKTTIDGLRHEMNARFSAVGDRFTELENSLDTMRLDFKTSAAEIVAQEMQILNAVQSALSVRSQMDDLTRR